MNTKDLGTETQRTSELPSQKDRPRFWGFHSKPVNRSLAILDSFDAIEYVEGSSTGRALTPFTVKLKKGFEHFTPDGNCFACSATRVHQFAALATPVHGASQRSTVVREKENKP